MTRVDRTSKVILIVMGLLTVVILLAAGVVAFQRPPRAAAVAVKPEPKPPILERVAEGGSAFYGWSIYRIRPTGECVLWVFRPYRGGLTTIRCPDDGTLQ